jgi:hypothetical protein
MDAANTLYRTWRDGDSATRRMIEDAVLNGHAVPANATGRAVAQRLAEMIRSHKGQR